MIRDTRKDTSYFKKYLTDQESRIIKFRQLAKDKEMAGDYQAANKAYGIISNFLKDKLYASYSIGTVISGINRIYSDWIDSLSKKLTYNEYVLMVSLGILLGSIGHTRTLVEVHINRSIFKNDILADSLSNYFLTNQFSSNSTTFISNSYSGLDGVFKEKNPAIQSNILAEYVTNQWYDDQRDESWHDSHLSTHDTYVGYWAFECAAIAKALALDVSKLIQSVYTPVDILITPMKESDDMWTLNIPEII